MKKRISSFLISAAVAVSAFANPEPAVLTAKDTITDNAIVYPESFETNTEKLMKNWYIQNYTALDQKVKSLPNNDVSDAVYIKRLKELPTVIEMPFNQIVKSYIQMYTQRRRNLVETMLGMSLYYLPIFEEALEKEGLPLELKYLPVIESALNPNAVSRAGAAGLWQFMVRTAKGMGLEVNSLVDERRDPYRSSEYAAKYLKELYSIYGDWSLAIASYNCGPGNVNKAIRRSGHENQADFWAIYEYLPRETRGYVPAFIAANYVMTYFNYHNISPALAKRPIITDTVHVTERIHLKQISDVLQLSLDELRTLNPQYRKDIIPGDRHPYSLVLPSQQVYSYIMSEDSILKHDHKLYAQRLVVEPGGDDGDNISGEKKATRKLAVKYYKVRRGDNITKVARKYGVTRSQIRKWNGLRNNTIRKGQRLKIKTYITVYEPVKKNDKNKSQNVDEEKTNQKKNNVTNERASSKKQQQTTKKNRSQNKQQYTIHKVRRGESLSVIANKYPGVTVRDIKRANNIKGTRIDVGDRLKIPKKR